MNTPAGKVVKAGPYTRKVEIMVDGRPFYILTAIGPTVYACVAKALMHCLSFMFSQAVNMPGGTDLSPDEVWATTPDDLGW